ncbi:MAG: nucleotidyltransferase family protein [Cytophagales bacterium]
MKSLSEIMEKLKEIKPYLVEKYGVSQLGIFGSYAYGMPN